MFRYIYFTYYHDYPCNTSLPSAHCLPLRDILWLFPEWAFLYNILQQWFSMSLLSQKVTQMKCFNIALLRVFTTCTCVILLQAYWCDMDYIIFTCIWFWINIFYSESMLKTSIWKSVLKVWNVFGGKSQFCAICYRINKWNATLIISM